MSIPLGIYWEIKLNHMNYSSVTKGGWTLHYENTHKIEFLVCFFLFLNAILLCRDMRDIGSKMKK